MTNTEVDRLEKIESKLISIVEPRFNYEDQFKIVIGFIKSEKGTIEKIMKERHDGVCNM